MPHLLRDGSNLETTHGWLQILSNQCIDVISSIKKAVTFNESSAWEQYKCLRNAVNSDVNTAKRNYYKNVVTLNSNDPKSLWKKINDLVRERKSQNSTAHGICASKFNDYFSTIGEKVSTKLHKQDVQEWRNPSPIYSFTFESICVETVYNDLQSLDCESKSDVLNLDTKLLKLSANVFL